MPPKKGIVKSGNSGNSAKIAKPVGKAGATSSTADNPVAVAKPPPLFPHGSKTPLALLYEQCKKNGWEKPEVEPRQNKGDGGYTCSILLKKFNKKTSSNESVRMEPHPPLKMGTKEEAKHWAATYVLYRIANNIQLHLVMPTEPRKYWAELADEHKKAPEHLAWQYAQDPFTARKTVDERQAQRKQVLSDRAANDEDSEGVQGIGFSARDVKVASWEFERAPEVKMSSALRDMVENAIKQTMPHFSAKFADAPDADSHREVDTTALKTQLGALGFKQHLIFKAIDFLNSPPPHTPYLTSLLAEPSTLDAALSHLLITTDEAELPKRFLIGNSNASSEGFISSAHAGAAKEDLPTRWMRDKATKEVGWPEKPVRECMALEGVGNKWDVLMEQLGRRLIGLRVLSNDQLAFSQDDGERDATRTDEIEAILAVYPGSAYAEDTGTLSIQLPETPIVVNLIYSPRHPYPLPQPLSDDENANTVLRFPPCYITLPSVAPYVRLHLLSRLLVSLSSNQDASPNPTDPHLRPLLESGEGILFAAAELLEGVWAEVQADGPPEVGEVMKHLLPPPATVPSAATKPKARTDEKGTTRTRKAAVDHRSNVTVMDDFNKMRGNPKYEEMLKGRQSLPAWNSKEEIVRLVDSHRVVVVVGETGCGKTTQLPQFLLDSEILKSNGKNVNIMITQPRRVSAIGVAGRVASERMEDGSVGYAIRGESKWTNKTKLLFVTTGVALRRLALEEGRMLAGISHIIVDEVHERSVDGDFLMLELRELLKRNKTIKIILMSATINQQTFVDYFGGAPVLEIPGFTFPVKDIYLEDVIPTITYRPSFVKPTQKQTEEQQRTFRETYQAKGLDTDAIRAIENITRSDRIDYQLIGAVIGHIVEKSTNPKGAILVFMSGVQEIRQAVEALNASPGVANQVDVLPLHANLTSDEQRRVFLPTSKRKVVVATNVAETSITIPDVVYVVDAGKVKETSYDPASGLSRLTETWITKAAARQRRGRAGRTQAGECYKLFTRQQEKKMSDFPIPEILRVPLESLSLQVKATREDEDVRLFLLKAIDPPKVDAMEKAWSVLKELGAVDEEDRLTALGRHMSLLPIDLRLSKMLVLAAIFHCLDPVLTVVTILSSKPLFFAPMEKRDEASQARRQFATANSDLLTDANAYYQCMQVRKDGNAAVRRFCADNFISVNTVRDITSLRQEFHAALATIGFVPLKSRPDDDELNTHSKNDNLVKAVILGGLWPRVARVETPKAVYDKIQAGTVQRDHEAKEFKIFEPDGRVYLHPQSIMFSDTLGVQKSAFFAYFSKNATSKVFLRDVTEIPLYGILLFGGPVSVNHVGGGLNIGGKDGWVKMKAWSRIGVLVNQLRRLLDAQLEESLDAASIADVGKNNIVMESMLALLEGDGLSV